MKDEDAAVSAIMAVFPGIEAFSGFIEDRDTARAVKSFTDFAFARGLIDTAEPKALEAFIRDHAGQLEQAPETGDLNFEVLVEQKSRLLEFNLSMRALAERVNSLIAHHRIELPGVSNSMLSRLKKEAADTPHKCNALRSLAFWIGHERPHLGRRFHYETLLKLCRQGRQQTEHKQGVRIGFALYSRGDVIDHEIVGWLKKNLKDYIDHAISRFAYGKWGKVRSQGITTLYVDFPKEGGATNPAAYRQCLRSAVSLAHQMAIRWSLSAYCTQNRFLSIGIAAGEFTVLDNYLLPVLNTKLAGDPVIRLTDYARQCILINDIRLLLCRQPAEITLFSGETLTIWWVEGFWSALYFDFIPDLLKDPVLAGHADFSETPANRLWISSAADLPAAGGAKAANAVSAFLKFPHDSLLGLEIAKTLYYRRRFREAMEILRIVLSLDPTRLNARTLRMVLLRNLALKAPSHEIAAGLFVQAEHEAAFIQKNCAFESEEFYCEYAVLYLARAMSTLGYMRRGSLALKTQQPAYFRQQVFADLDQAESLFTMGITVSPTGIRSAYLLSTVRVLRVLLQSRPRIFESPDCPIDGHPEEIRQVVRKLHWQFGYIREDFSEQAAASPWVEEIFSNQMVSHDDSIALQAYRPTTYFCAAVAWWDLFPVRTVRGAAKAVELLEQAAAMAEDVAKQGVCIYAFTRTYGEMMPAGEFVEHMHRGIRMIREQAGQKLSEKDGAEVIASADNGPSSLLMTLNY